MNEWALVILNTALLGVGLLLALPIGMFTLEVLLSCLPRRRVALDVPARQPRLAVLIPAHNEEAVIGRTLSTLMPTIPSGCRVIVVADNCTDATARFVREAGAEVVERFDTSRRGKGFALDFGLQSLATDPPDAVVFLDADCQVAGDTVRLLGTAAVASGRPVQGLNLCDPDPNGGPLQQVSGLAFRFKNLVRTLGLTRLAGLCYLTGTGMALPWKLARQSKLADGNVVEDMQLGIDLARAGYPTLFLPEARVDSPLPQHRRAARTQRTRWEHGHLTTLLTQVPRLIGLAVAKRRFDLLCLALDLAIPPLSLLVALWATVWFVSLAAWMSGGGLLPLALISAQGTALAVAVVIGWGVHCRRQVALCSLLAAPFYAIWKLPIYAAFIVHRQRQWIRTSREPQTAKSA